MKKLFLLAVHEQNNSREINCYHSPDVMVKMCFFFSLIMCRSVRAADGYFKQNDGCKSLLC